MKQGIFVIDEAQALDHEPRFKQCMANIGINNINDYEQIFKSLIIAISSQDNFLIIIDMILAHDIHIILNDKTEFGFLDETKRSVLVGMMQNNLTSGVLSSLQSYFNTLLFFRQNKNYFFPQNITRNLEWTKLIPIKYNLIKVIALTKTSGNFEKIGSIIQEIKKLNPTNEVLVALGVPLALMYVAAKGDARNMNQILSAFEFTNDQIKAAAASAQDNHHPEIAKRLMKKIGDSHSIRSLLPFKKNKNYFFPQNVTSSKQVNVTQSSEQAKQNSKIYQLREVIGSTKTRGYFEEIASIIQEIKKLNPTNEILVALEVHLALVDLATKGDTRNMNQLLSELEFTNKQLEAAAVSAKDNKHGKIAGILRRKMKKIEDSDSPVMPAAAKKHSRPSNKSYSQAKRAKNDGGFANVNESRTYSYLKSLLPATPQAYSFADASASGGEAPQQNLVDEETIADTLKQWSSFSSLSSDEPSMSFEEFGNLLNTYLQQNKSFDNNSQMFPASLPPTPNQAVAFKISDMLIDATNTELPLQQKDSIDDEIMAVLLPSFSSLSSSMFSEDLMAFFKDAFSKCNNNDSQAPSARLR